MLTPVSSSPLVISLTVDATALNCPMPLLKLRQALHQLEAGQIVRLLATDPNSQQDILRYCEKSGQILHAADQTSHADKPCFVFDIEKI